MSWTVLVTTSAFPPTGQQATALLQAAGCKLVFPPRFGPFPAEELRPLLPGVDAILASLDEYSAPLLAAPEARQLKLIARWGVGYDAVDIPAATAQGIVVTYTPGMLDSAVADYAFALLLALARRVHEGHLHLHAGQWQPAWGTDVAGKTLGLLGCGRIGLAVARRASGFDLRLLAHDPVVNPDALKCGVRYVSLDELLAESDFLSLHAALTPASRGLIGEAQLRRMKPTALLINTARGALVNEVALARALQEGWIAGAALDVFQDEPLPAQHPLRTAPNLLLSPHQSSFSRETGQRVSVAAAETIVDLMRGRRPPRVLNPAVFDAPTLRARIRNGAKASNP